MNELRQAIESIKVDTSDNEHGDYVAPLTHLIPPQTIDAILDAVIAALPEPVDGNNPIPELDAGRMDYHVRFKALLKAAKESKQ